MFGRFIRKESQRTISKEVKTEPDVEDDQSNSSLLQNDEVPKEKMTIYTKPQAEDYHLYKTCQMMISQEQKSYFEEKNPCRICINETEDVLCSTIGPKWHGFILGRVEYQDDECLCWISHKQKKRCICRYYEKEKIYEKAIKKSLIKKEKEGKAMSSGSKVK